MKIVQIITMGHNLYGAQRHVIDLCVKLQTEGHEVILVMGSEGKMQDFAHSLGINTLVLRHLKRSIHPYHDLVGTIELIQLFKKLQPDVIASHSSKAGILARVAAWWLKIPNTFTAHGWSFAQGIPFLSRKIFQFIEALVGLISNKIITVSKADKDYALKLGVIDESKMSIIHYGINPPITIHKKGTSIEKSPFNMVMSARFQAQKDHATLIKALIPLKYLNWQLFLLGDGELMPAIQDKVHQGGLSNKVFFEGAVSNVSDYLNKADVFLLITNWEGLPISILEAMAHSLPVIASDVDGIKEEIIDGINGFLVPRKDIKSITSAISTLYHNRELAVNMGIKSKDLFEKQFTIDIMARNTIELYSQISSKIKNDR